jgi:hypothetical protein
LHPDSAFIAFRRSEQGKAELEMAIQPDIYGDIDVKNGWTEPDEPEAASQQAAAAADVERASKVFREFLLFVLGVKLFDSRGKTCQQVVRRFAALAYYFTPEMLRMPPDGQLRHTVKSKQPKGPPISLAALSRQPSVNCDPKLLKKMAQQFRERLDQLS